MDLTIYYFGKRIYFPEEVIVNGKWTFRLQGQRIGNTGTYTSGELGWISPDSVYCIEPKVEKKHKKLLSHRITVGSVPGELQPSLPGLEGEGKRSRSTRVCLTRLFDRLYAPDFRKQHPAHVEAFYDYVAPIYDADITAELNAQVWQRLISSARAFEREKTIEFDQLRVLDFGVGTGATVERGMQLLSANLRSGDMSVELYGCDLSAGMIRICREKRASLFAGGKAGIRKAFYVRNGLGFPRDFFDVAVACFVEHHFPDEMYSIPFEQMKQVLKPGGILAFNLFKPRSGWLEITDEMLLGLGFEHMEYRVLAFGVGGRRRLIPLVFARRPQSVEKPLYYEGELFQQQLMPDHEPCIQGEVS